LASLKYDSNCNALYIRLKRGKAAESSDKTDVTCGEGFEIVETMFFGVC